MRTVIHLSDLHFGRINRSILEPLLGAIEAARPDVVAVSGDLTQRSRTAEYLAAREFLARIRFAQIVVPGNHDVPLRNPFARFIGGLEGFQRYITADLEPFYLDDEIAVAGLNTARALTWKSGRINRGQLARLSARLEPLGPDYLKILVTHHPFDLPAGAKGRVVGRSRLAVQTLAACGVDLLLAGHFHIADTGHTATRYQIPGYSALIVSSGTTTSTRDRGQPNSFNLLRLAGSCVTIERQTWRPAGGMFERCSIESFERPAKNREWIRVNPQP